MAKIFTLSNSILCSIFKEYKQDTEILQNIAHFYNPIQTFIDKLWKRNFRLNTVQAREVQVLSKFICPIKAQLSNCKQPLLRFALNNNQYIIQKFKNSRGNLSFYMPLFGQGSLCFTTVKSS